MTVLKQISLLALAACLGLFLVGCQPSDPDSPKVATVSSITVTPNPVNMEIDGFRALTVTGTFTDGSSAVVNSGTTFASSATAVATVDARGYVTAVAAGTATITATHTESGSTATTSVTVSPLRTLSIAVTPATSVLTVGASQALTVTATYNNATTGNVTSGSTFVSSNPAVATVGASGVVTAVALGDAVITATHTASGKTGTAAVSVSVTPPGGGFSSIDFDTAGIDYALTGFGGAEDSSLQPDPTDAANTVARVNRSATAETFAGTVVSTGADNTVDRIPFTSTSTKMTVRVYSPAAGIKVLLKVEDAADPERFVQTEAATTVANAWETLTFDFANNVAGTPALDPAVNYNRIIIFFDFGLNGAAVGARTYYFDDVTFVEGSSAGSGSTGTCTDPCIDFASASVKYEAFEGLVSAAQSDDPVDPSNKVAKFVKGPSGQPWAGATIYTVDADKSVPEFDLSTSKIVTLRVYSPVVGMNVRLKLEDAGNNAIYLEQDVLTTRANEWETLSFDFATPVNGVYDAANTYNRVSVFPAFSTTAPPASNLTVYFDELDYDTTGGGGNSGSTGTCAATNCTDFSGGGIGFGPFENQGGGTVAVASDPNDATNDVVKFVKKPGDGDYFGTTITGLAGPAELTATDKTVTLRVFSPTVGTNFLLKLEGGPGGAVVEKDMVTTVAGAWETLSFDLSAGAAGIYDVVVVFPNGRSSVAADKTMYIDELKFPVASAGPGSGSTGTCTGDACVDFSEPGIGFGPFENQGGGTVAIVDDPNDATNKVARFVKKPGDGDYFGTTITGLGGSVVLTAGSKTVTMRVYSPAAGTNFLLKLEGGTGGPATTEKDMATTVAGAWETLSFVMPDAGTYTTVVVFPNGRSPVAADKTMYIDELKFPAFTTGGGGGGGGFANGVFADDYVGDLPATAKSTQGGDVGFFFDPRLAKDVGATYDYAGVSGTAQNPGGVPNFYYGLGLNAPAITNAYFGAFVKSPGNGSVDVSGYTNILVNVWGPDQLFQAGTFPALEVILQGPAVAGCGSPSGGSEVNFTFNTTGQGADKIYTLPLGSFIVTSACSGETSVAEVLANIVQVNIVLKNSNIQYVNKDPDGVAFTNGLNVGSIKFN